MKLNSAVYLSNNGLGDNITSIGAVNYLLDYYDYVYFFCKTIYLENVKLFFHNKNVLFIDVDASNEFSICSNIINDIYYNKPDIDIFTSGCFKDYHRRISHPELINRISDDNGYATKYEFIRDFYHINNLDLSIYCEKFNIESCKISIDLYNDIKTYKIIFMHTKASNATIDLSHVIGKYKDNPDFIIICSNQNVYNLSHKNYEIANKFVNLYIAEYIDIIKNSYEIHVIDSCFSAILLPLQLSKRLDSSICFIYERDVAVHMRKSILVLGDSHVNIYNHSNINNYFNLIRIIHTDCEDVERNGKFVPYLMNTVSNKGEKYLSHFMKTYQNLDYILYIFGEPDVRIHFDKQINLLNRNEDEVIETLCKNYIKKLLEITPENTSIIIRYILPQRIYSMFNTLFIPKGNISDRVRYTNKMNQKLNELCNINNIYFLDNYEKNNLINEDGSLKDEFCDGTTHYNENSINYINNELRLFTENILG